jgi:PAS domain S-box-containing protein
MNMNHLFEQEDNRAAILCDSAENDSSSDSQSTNSALQQFQAIFHETLDAILITDDQGKYIDANPAACELLGLPREELLGCSIANFAQPGVDVAQAWRSFLEQGRVTGEVRLLRPDGTVRETEFAATANILPHRHLSVLRDITGRKKVEQELQESQRWLQKIAEAVPCLYIHDQIQDCNVYMNHYGREFFDRTQTELQAMGSQYLAEVLHPDDYARLAEYKQCLAALKDDQVFESEYCMKNAQGEWRWFHAWEVVFTRTAEGTVEQILGTAIDITERKQAEAALAEKQHLVEQIAESTAAMLYIYDLIEQRNIYCNRQVSEILGYSPETVQALGTTFVPTLIHPDDVAKTTAHLQKFATAKDGEVLENEYRLRHANGEWRWLYSRDIVFARTVEGSPQQILGTVTDITHLKRVEEDLRQSEERLRLALEATGMGIWDWNLLTNSIVWSKGHEELFGLASGTFDGTYAAFEACIHPEDREAIAQTMNCALLERHDYHQEFRVVWPDGSLHWIEGKGKFFYDESNQAVRMLGTVIDISDRKLAEAQILSLNAQLEQRVLERTEELRRTNQELKQEIRDRNRAEEALRLQAERERLMVAIANQIRQSLNLADILSTTVTQVRQFLKCDRVLIYRTGSNGTGSVITEAVAPGCPAILGHPLPENIFPQECHQWYSEGRIRTVTDVEHDEMSPCLAEMLRGIGVKSKIVVPIIEQEALWGLLIAHQCGTPRQWQTWEAELLSSLATQVAIAIQQAELYSQLATELTQRKQAQQERDRFFNLSLDMLVIANLDGYFTHVNPAWESALGFTPQELTSQPLIEFVHPEDRAATWAEMAKLVAGITVNSFENRYRCRDGSYKWLSWTGVPFLEERLVYCVARDVTDRKLAQQALQESEERFRATFEQAAVGICLCSLDGQFLRLNQKFCDILGYTHAEMLNRTWMDITYPEDLNADLELARGVMEREIDTYTIEKRYIRKDGSMIWVNLTGSSVRSSSGEPKYGLAVIEDISERKRIEEELRESQQKYHTLFQIFPIGISITDQQGNLIEVNPASETILGISAQEQTSRQYDAPQWHIVRPDGTPLPISDYASVRALTENRAIENVEMGIVKPNDEITWISVTAAPIPLPNYGVAIAYIDITERKRATSALQESEQRFRTLADFTYDWEYWTAPDGTFIYVSPSCERITGYPAEDFLNDASLLEAIIHPDDRARIAENLCKQVENPQVYTTDFRIITRNGEVRWIGHVCQPVYSTDGCWLGQRVSNRDISQRRLAEEKLRQSEERFRNLVETTSDWVWEMDQRQVYTYTSPKVSDILGYEAQEILGRTPFDFMSFKEAKRLARFLGYIFASREPFTCLEITSLHKNGHLVIMETSGVPIFDTDGKFSGYRGISRNISDAYRQAALRKRMEDALRESQQKYQTLFEILPIGISITDKQGNLIEANPASEQILGMPIAERLKHGHDASKLHLIRSDGTPMPREEFVNVRALTENRALKNHEAGVVKPDGTITWLNATAAPIPLPGYGAVLAYIDITERKQAEAALQQAKEAAEMANRAKSEFLANMSHELRTPLNGILGYTQLLKKDTNLTDQQQDSLSIIHQCGEHLLTLIDDILDLSKIEARKMELYPREFHLPNFLKSLADLFHFRAQQKGISLNYEILSPLPQGVMGDNKRLRQVISNLLNNAVKFTERGGVTFKVGYCSVVSGQWSIDQTTQQTSDNKELTTNKIRIQIEDTGIGIQPSQLEDIFLPFHQVNERTHAIEGTGLGLAISQKLVRMMGSEIKVKSTLGKGSVFWFDLDLPLVSGWHEPKPSSDRQIVGFKGDRRKVLIVDDDRINRLVLRKLLKSLGFDILEAIDGQDCLNKAVDFQPDVILMDLVMPELDGLEVTRRLRQLPQLRDAVVIALSANAFEATKQESLAAGCQDFLSKPVPTQQLLDLLGLYLRLEWIYEEGLSSPAFESNRDRVPLVPPSPSKLALLSELVKMGDIAGILDQADQLQHLDSKLEPFATEIRQLAKDFKLKQLRKIIQQFLANTQ